jgi:hypothetical protein
MILGGIPLALLMSIFAHLGRRRPSLFWQNADDALQERKRVLAGLLPQDFLTPDGFLWGRDGKPEPICIVTSKGLSSAGLKETPEVTPSWWGGATYSGGLGCKPFRHRLEQCRDMMPAGEFTVLSDYFKKELTVVGSEDIIDVSHAKDMGTVAHETFHDIQGFLYDNHPEIIEALQQAVLSRKEAIAAWHQDPTSAPWTAPPNYRLAQLFPETVDDVPYDKGLLASAILSLDTKLNHHDISEIPWDSVLMEGWKDIGRLEAIPVMLSAAVGGNEGAKVLLRDIFAEAGLTSELFSAPVDSRPQSSASNASE